MITVLKKHFFTLGMVFITILLIIPAISLADLWEIEAASKNVQNTPNFYSFEPLAQAQPPPLQFPQPEDLIGPNQAIPQIPAPDQSPPEQETPIEPSTPPPSAPQEEQKEGLVAAQENPPRTILINFNNVSIIEYIRFISRISNKNFIFDENDLQFNVTIISEEPATINTIMAALLQELRIHDLILLEDGNNLIVHKNPKVSGISKVVAEDIPESKIKDTEIITQVFRLNTVDPEKAALIVRPLVSDTALVEVLKDTNHIIITDLTYNVSKIAQLLRSLDAPNSGLVIGQYVVRVAFVDQLIPLAEKIMLPISQEQPLIFVPHPNTNSIFIVSTPFLVERTISILQYLDQERGATRILDLKDLKFDKTVVPSGAGPEVPGTGQRIQRTPSGQWIPNADGSWNFLPSPPHKGDEPHGSWLQDDTGNWFFQPGGEAKGVQPKGSWQQDENGNWLFNLEKGEVINPEKLSRQYQGGTNVPGGFQKRVKFYVHKLLYRRGDEVEQALANIANTLRVNDRGNEDLIATLESVQWLQTTNTLVFSGTIEALDKAREIMSEVDIPLRQVFIEVLVLNANIDDALSYGVNYGTRFGGGPSSGAQGFVAGATPLIGALTSTVVTGLGGPVTAGALPLIPNGTNLANNLGFQLGVIGQKLTHNGTRFDSIGALVTAIHNRNDDSIVMNPKIIAEDGSTAELFIGINTSFQTQSITNNLGQNITNNFEFRDVGTRLKITPYLNNGDMITLDILQEISSVLSGAQLTNLTNTTTNQNAIGPTTSKNTTTTRVHIPSGYFLIISGMMQDEVLRTRSQTPCLGATPILGAFLSNKINQDTKRNVLMFLRPIVVDTIEEMQHLTKHEQDVWRYKRCLQESFDYEVDQGLDWFNVRSTLSPEDRCHCDSECECECQ